MCIFGYSGGGGEGGWVTLQLSDWAHLASQLSSHLLYQSTYGTNPIRIFCYREKDENILMSADADMAA